MLGSWNIHNTQPTHKFDEFKGKSTKYLEEAYVILLHRLTELLDNEKNELGRLRAELESRLGKLDHDKYSRMVAERHQRILRQSRDSNPDIYKLLSGVKGSVHAVGGF